VLPDSLGHIIETGVVVDLASSTRLAGDHSEVLLRIEAELLHGLSQEGTALSGGTPLNPFLEANLHRSRTT